MTYYFQSNDRICKGSSKEYNKEKEGIAIRIKIKVGNKVKKFLILYYALHFQKINYKQQNHANSRKYSINLKM